MGCLWGEEGVRKKAWRFLVVEAVSGLARYTSAGEKREVKMKELIFSPRANLPVLQAR